MIAHNTTAHEVVFFYLVILKYGPILDTIYIIASSTYC